MARTTDKVISQLRYTPWFEYMWQWYIDNTYLGANLEFLLLGPDHGIIIWTGAGCLYISTVKH